MKCREAERVLFVWGLMGTEVASTSKKVHTSPRCVYCLLTHAAMHKQGTAGCRVTLFLGVCHFFPWRQITNYRKSILWRKKGQDYEIAVQCMWDTRTCITPRSEHLTVLSGRQSETIEVMMRTYKRMEEGEHMKDTAL